nr:glycerol-3-phosphate dehydrogenase [Sphingomonas japonica]
MIIGGGINGCAIAREAALNGLDVRLVERDDLAGHTSSASTGLIHGGLRYLEQFEFRLVAHALAERERLIAAAPHLIHPMRFVLPHAHAMRPWWIVRIGLHLYDWIGGGTRMLRSRGLRASDIGYRAPLSQPGKGFVYSDAWVDDARLTLANALDAARHGAVISTQTELTGACREGDCWVAALSDGATVMTRAIVNAAGPWVASLLDRLEVNTASGVRLVKGSHIVVPRLYDGDHAYMLQQPDRRIVFAIPYQDDFTEIGTTDVTVKAPEDAVIDDAEIAYLCAAVNRYFSRQTEPDDIVSTWSGIRPLYDDGAATASQVTRDYVLDLDDHGPALLNVFGGKITTARHLAEEAIERLAPTLGLNAHPVTRARVLPGGAIPEYHRFVDQVRAAYPFLGDARAVRMARAYGSDLHVMLDGIADAQAMGADLGAGLTQIELRWMVDREWATTVDDVLWRRSKLGLRVTDAERTAIAATLSAIRDPAAIGSDRQP